jgi:hypothetical protein
MKIDIEKISNYVSSRESIYVLLLLFITMINLVVFNDKPIILLLVNIVAIVIYFIISQRKDKMIVILTCVNFAFWGVIFESFIIKNSNFALNYRYGTNITGLYVPAWLFTIYIIFVLTSLYSYDFYKTIY